MPPKFSREINSPMIYDKYITFQTRTSPCEAACPAGLSIQKMNGLVAENDLEAAYSYLLSKNPFAAVTGRVCSHFCESDCNRKQMDDAVAIRSIERFISDQAAASGAVNPKKNPPSGKKIAIIGSGPAGLTCAFYSALFGHQVVVYEASGLLGGMMKLGIPDFRLPKYLVDREVGKVLALGVEVKTNTAVGVDVSLDELLEQYDACLVAVGAWKEKSLSIPGIENALSGLSFLRSVNLGERNKVGDSVVIIGGGGVAFDCAFVAKRLGAKQVRVVCVEAEDCMRATAEDLVQAADIGVEIHHSSLISKITRADGVCELETQAISSFNFDECGQLSFECASSEPAILKADTVIQAIGLEPDLDKLGLDLNQKKILAIDPATMATSVAGLFAAGDVSTGPGSVSAAIGSGRTAAVFMDNYLQGRKWDDRFNVLVAQDGAVSLKKNRHVVEPRVVPYKEILNLDYYESKERVESGRISPEAAAASFAEIELGFASQAEAAAEAARCMHCGHCQLCGQCVEVCPGYCLEMTEDGPVITYPDECWHCGNCRTSCPSSAVSYQFPIATLV